LTRTGSALIYFPVEFSGGSRVLSIYKQILYSIKQESEKLKDANFLLDRLKNLQSPTVHLWGFFMLGSGHFAGAIYDCMSGQAIVHKTFHRYTTRRKQGGAQSTSDNSKGKAKSAGSALRRYNELALQQVKRKKIHF